MATDVTHPELSPRRNVRAKTGPSVRSAGGPEGKTQRRKAGTRSARAAEHASSGPRATSQRAEANLPAASARLKAVMRRTAYLTRASEEMKRNQR